jgi:hypothetical protein
MKKKGGRFGLCEAPEGPPCGKPNLSSFFSAAMKRLLAIFLILVVAGSVSSATTRTWKSSNGRFSIEAELVDFKDGTAQLKKSDDTVIDVPLLSLSADDRKYVKDQFPGVEEENFRPGVEYREWKSRNGKFSTLAEFLGYSDGSVQLRKPDGSDVSVERKLLSAADQRWITDELGRQHKEHEEDADSKSTEKASAREVVGQIAAQEIPMTLVRLDQPKGKTRAKGGVPADYVLFRLITPQQFYMQAGKGGSPNEAEFRGIVRKEPKYNASIPFRGVAGLGSHRHCFALDRAETKNASYDRLYFDANGNGDLTDDKPVAAIAVNSLNPLMTQSKFPRMDVSIDVDGKSFEYAFLLSAICSKAPPSPYTTVSLYSAAVREGYLTQGTKRTKLLLLDRNSNGRFDDTFSVRSALSVAEGDLLLINPNLKNKLSADATLGSERNFVSKTVCLGREFYQMEIRPSGDSLKLTPTKPSLGSVTNPSPAYRSVVFNEDYGVLMLGGMKDQKVPLPEGEWKVLNYTIDASGFAGGAGTAVAASFGEHASTVTVSKKEVAKLPFGPPFHAVVTARRTDPQKVSLSLAIAGVAGEQCTSFFVKGTRPPRPRFVIEDKDGKAVHQGSFEYG